MRTIINVILATVLALGLGLTAADAFRPNEAGNLTRDHNNNAMPVLRYSGTAQNVTVTGTSAPTVNPVDAETHFVRIICTEDSWMTIGTAPTALLTDLYLAADVETVMRVLPGTDKLAFIEDATTGTCNVAEMR